METLAIVLIVLVFVILTKSVVIVRQGYEYTVENFGRFTRSLHPGFHLLIPVLETIGAKINRKEQVLEVSSQEVITKDNAMVTVNGVLFYQIQDATKAAYQVEDLDYAIMNLVMTNIRTVIGSMEIDELLSQRNIINQKLLSVVDEATIPWGVKVTRVEIKDITPPKDLIDAMARQMKAEREKRANILEAEGKKEAAFREAEARERSAQAEAMATQLISDAIAKGDPKSLSYFLGQQYISALQGIVTSPNEKLLMLPVDTTQVMGTVAGISELVKDVMNTKPAAKKAANKE